MAQRLPSKAGSGLLFRLGAQPGRDELAERERLALDVRRALLAHVERHDGGESHEDADARGDQGLGDAGHDVVHARAVASAQVLEGLDDTDDGAEQPHERRVVPERSEEGHAVLEARALTLDARVHRFEEGVRATATVVECATQHVHLDRLELGQRGLEIRDAAATQGLVDALAQAGGSAPVAAEEERALEDRPDRDDREAEEEVEHPGAAQQRDVHQLFDDVHGGACLCS
ncbi:MAG: hypothetical protein IPG17_00280 [Sandaracinaceae bacterium]|nr:hypothetical protein [Sandaracinaceae bacterium]